MTKKLTKQIIRLEHQAIKNTKAGRTKDAASKQKKANFLIHSDVHEAKKKISPTGKFLPVKSANINKIQQEEIERYRKEIGKRSYKK